jgi:hypothetical protein
LHESVPVMLYPVSITHAHVILLHYVSVRHIFASLQSSGRCIISHMRASFMTTVHFVSTLTSGYGSFFQSHIIPSYSFTLENGTVFLNRESYFCLIHISLCFSTHEYVTILSQSRALRLSSSFLQQVLPRSPIISSVFFTSE